jgi:hypothetical protein
LIDFNSIFFNLNLEETVVSKRVRQLKLDRFPSEFPKKQKEYEKHIVITKLDSTLIWDELLLEIDFKLIPNKIVFSKIRADLWFDQKATNSFLFDILHSFGPTNDFTLKTTLDLQGLPSGTHSIKVEMYELWSFLEKHNHTEKEITIEYTPQTKKAMLKEVPIIKKIEGEGIAIVSESEKHIYQEMQETRKKELASEREK